MLIVFVASTAPQLGKHSGLRDDDDQDGDGDDDSRQYSDNDASRCQNSKISFKTCTPPCLLCMNWVTFQGRGPIIHLRRGWANVCMERGVTRSSGCGG